MRSHDRFCILPLLIGVALWAAACSDDDTTGPGTSGSTCEFSVPSLDFGSVEVGQTKVLSCTITNTGTRTIRGDLTSGTCTQFGVRGGPFELPAGEFATILVSYTPSDVGPHACDIQTGTGCGVLPVTGNGVTTAVPTGGGPNGSGRDEA